MNLSPAAGWVGDEAQRRGTECLMHPATTQQFALKSLLLVWKERVKSKLTPDRMYNDWKRAVYEQLLEPHWLHIGFPRVRTWIINSRLFSPPYSTRDTSPAPPLPVLSKSYSISTGRRIALPSSCNNCVPIVRRTSSWPTPCKWPLWGESQWLYAPAWCFEGPSCLSADTRACGKPGRGGGGAGRRVWGESHVCEMALGHTRLFA